MAVDFITFPKIPRLSRDIVITEKIDGTNAQIYIEGNLLIAGSRNRWVTPENDNHGFASWVEEHRQELLTLGPGRHFGEWWGRGIQRGYGLAEKRFSIFNVSRYVTGAPAKGQIHIPDCCHIVPTLYIGSFDMPLISFMLEHLEQEGSYAAPGYNNPEGIVIYHTAGNCLFKKTIKDDDKPKG